jgi:hypothetical protein
VRGICKIMSPPDAQTQLVSVDGHSLGHAGIPCEIMRGVVEKLVGCEPREVVIPDLPLHAKGRLPIAIRRGLWYLHCRYQDGRIERCLRRYRSGGTAWPFAFLVG